MQVNEKNCNNDQKLIKKNIRQWMLKMIQRQLQFEKQYRETHSIFAEAYNDFLSILDNINFEHGTSFTIQQAVEEFGGEEVDLDDDDEE